MIITALHRVKAHYDTQVITCSCYHMAKVLYLVHVITPKLPQSVGQQSQISDYKLLDVKLIRLTWAPPPDAERFDQIWKTKLRARFVLIRVEYKMTNSEFQIESTNHKIIKSRLSY